MHNFTTQNWIDRALTSDHGVWNVGQLDDGTVKVLNGLVKQGEICKSRGSFEGISPPKTIWHKPGAIFSYMENVTLVAASGAALEQLYALRVELEQQSVAA